MDLNEISAAVSISDSRRITHTVYLPVGEGGPIGYVEINYPETPHHAIHGWLRTYSAQCGHMCSRAATGMGAYVVTLGSEEKLGFLPACDEHGEKYAAFTKLEELTTGTN